MLSRLIFYILLLAFFGVTIFILFFSSYLKITDIKIDGTRELEQVRIMQVLEGPFQGAYLGIFPRDNFLFISSSRIERILKESYKKIRQVRVEKKFPGSLEVIIDERKALLVWCSGENCFLIDDGGVAYSAANFGSQEIIENNLIKISDLSRGNVSIGEKVLNDGYEKYLLHIHDAAKEQGMELGNEYTTPSRMAEEIDAATPDGTRLQLSTQFALENAMRTLGIILKKEIPVEKRSELDYIDLRSENKAFYKFKNQPGDQVTEKGDENKAQQN